MQRHAEGCGNLWKRQSRDFNSLSHCNSANGITAMAKTMTKSKSGEWVVIPVFIDIVRLALKTRDECMKR